MGLIDAIYDIYIYILIYKINFLKKKVGSMDPTSHDVVPPKFLWIYNKNERMLFCYVYSGLCM